jgi:hypothetical protein
MFNPVEVAQGLIHSAHDLPNWNQSEKCENAELQGCRR